MTQTHKHTGKQFENGHLAGGKLMDDAAGYGKAIGALSKSSKISAFADLKGPNEWE